VNKDSPTGKIRSLEAFKKTKKQKTKNKTKTKKTKQNKTKKIHNPQSYTPAKIQCHTVVIFLATIVHNVGS